MQNHERESSERQETGRREPMLVTASGERLSVIRVIAMAVGMSSALGWLPIEWTILGFESGVITDQSLLKGCVATFLLVCAVVSLLAICGIMRSASIQGRYLSVSGALATAIGSILFWLMMNSTENRLLIGILASLLLGVGFCLMFGVWVSAFGGVDHRVYLIAMFCALCVFCLLSTIAGGLDSISICILTSAGAFLCAAIYFVCSPLGERVDVAARVREGKTVIIRAAISFLLIGFAIAYSMTQFVGNVRRDNGMPTVFWLVSLGVLSVLFAIILFANRTREPTYVPLFRFLPILMTFAFIPFEYLGAFSMTFSVLCLEMTFVVSMLLSLMVCRELASLTGTPHSFLTAIFALSASSGAEVGVVLNPIVAGNETSLMFIFAPAICLLCGVLGADVILTRIVGSSKVGRSESEDSSSNDGAVSEDPGLDDKCRKVAEKYALTERESDVLGILAHGYGLNRVEEELFVSEGTAVTHKRNIYRKLGIHSKTELIDLVDGIR